MKLAGAVVLYNPGSDVLENINSYIEQLDILYVLDNSDNSNDELIKKIIKIEKCCYKDMKGNKGIACALNRALKCASKAGYQWLLTMDQDSRMFSDSLKKMKEYIITNTDEKTVIVCARYKDYKDKRNTCPKEISYVMEAITSGSIVNVSIGKKIGGFLNELFIDEVDNEFCYRAILNGYKIVRLNNVIFQHSLGKQDLQKGLIIYNYPPIRYYYIIRNRCYVIKKYKQYPRLEQMCNNKKNSITDWIVRVAHENNRMVKYGYIILGFIHCQLGIMGKFENHYKKEKRNVS